MTCSPTGVVVGRIMKAAAAPEGTPWMWTHHEDPHADARRRADARGRDGGVRQDLAAGVVQWTPKTEVEATSILPSLNGKTARSWRGIVPFTHLAREGAYDSHYRTAGIAGRTRRRGGDVATDGTCAAVGDAGDWIS